MATKGASFRYGNINGSHHRGKASEHINYQWAKDFNKGGLKRHYKDHGKEFNATSKEDYAAKAIHFANEINRKFYKSVIDRNGTTYKYDSRDGRLVEVTDDGYVISYRYTGEKFWYYAKKGIKKWIKMRNK